MVNSLKTVEMTEKIVKITEYLRLLQNCNIEILKTGKITEFLLNLLKKSKNF